MTHRSELTLVSHNLCPYVQRAAIALAEKGVAFERILIDLSAKPSWFMAISPMGRVPLLKVARAGGGEAVLFESSVLCEYIEETQAGPALHPDEPLRRAEHRAWMEFGSAILGDIWLMEIARDAAAFEDARQALATKLGRVEAVLEAGPWFGGARFGYVDATFAPVFRYFDLFDRLADLGLWPALPRITAWRARLATRRSVIDAVGEDYPELLHDFLRQREAYLLTMAS